MRFFSICLVVFAATFVGETTLQAQVVHISEDFSSASGGIPPTGWFVYTGPGHTSTDPNVEWRFDSPTLQYGSAQAPMSDPMAISDTDFQFTTQTDAMLESPQFDSTLAPNTILEFDYTLRLGGGVGTADVEVFDGTNWVVATTLTQNDPTMVLANSHVNLDITAFCGNHTAVSVRFRHNITDGWHFGVDNVEIYGIPDFALTVVSLTGPTIDPFCNLNLTNNETIQVQVRNDGAAIVGYIIELYNNGVQIGFVNPLGTLDRGAVGGATFFNVDMSNPGENVLEVRAYPGADPAPYPGDNIPLVAPYNNPVSLGYVQDFDALTPSANTHASATRVVDVPPGWENVLDDSASLSGVPFAPDWYTKNGVTSSNQGPLYDHTQGPGGIGGTGIYMHVEDSASTIGNVELRSPCLSPAGAMNNPTVKFYVHSDTTAGAPNDNILEIDVINETTGGSVTTSFITGIQGHGPGPDWVPYFVDLSAFGSDVVRVQFRVAMIDFDFMDDLAIDDFSYFDVVTPTGQAPVPGSAVLDINNAKNAYAQFVSSGAPGPYTANVAAGSSLQFSWGGMPAQIVQMWGGPLLVNAANFPGLGQIDTGDGTLGMFGIPNGLFLVGDGANVGTAAGTLFDTFFFTGIGGSGGFSAIIPDFLPPGTLSTFQMIVKDPSLGLAQSTISNAVRVVVTP